MLNIDDHMKAVTACNNVLADNITYAQSGFELILPDLWTSIMAINDNVLNKVRHLVIQYQIG